MQKWYQYKSVMREGKNISRGVMNFSDGFPPCWPCRRVQDILHFKEHFFTRLSIKITRLKKTLRVFGAPVCSKIFSYHYATY